MDVSIVAAIIGLGGAVLGASLTAFLQPYYERKHSPKSVLQIEIKHQSFGIPVFLNEQIEKYIYEFGYKTKIKEPAKSIFRDIRIYNGYSILTIKNISQKTITGITASFEGNRDFLYDIEKDGKKGGTGKTTSCDVGSLRPNTSCVLQIWSYSDLSTAYNFNKKEPIEVTADHIESVQIQKPLPRYLEEVYQRIPHSWYGRATKHFSMFLIIVYLVVIFFQISEKL